MTAFHVGSMHRTGVLHDVPNIPRVYREGL
jgi:hypothetical protein